MKALEKVWAKIRLALMAVFGELKAYAKAVAFVAELRANRRGAVAYSVVDILVGVIIVGNMGIAAFNYSATNFSAADATTQTMLGTVVPMLAAIGIGLLFLKTRRN